MRPLSTLRLTLLRLCYAVLVVGLSLRYAPVFLDGLHDLPRMDSVVVALLSAMGLLAVAGLFSPLRMLPLLVFEIAWKLIWVCHPWRLPVLRIPASQVTGTNLQG